MDKVFSAAAADLHAMVGEVDQAVQGLIDAAMTAATNTGAADEAATVAYASQTKALANRKPVAAAQGIPPVPPAPAATPGSDSAGGAP